MNFASTVMCVLCTRGTHGQKVMQIIHEVADAHIYAASRAIQRSLEETMDEVTFVLDKASIPRPPALGNRAVILIIVIDYARTRWSLAQRLTIIVPFKDSNSINNFTPRPVGEYPVNRRHLGLSEFFHWACFTQITPIEEIMQSVVSGAAFCL